MLVVNSFNASRFGGEWEGFTWQWYERLWDAEEVWDAFFITLKVAVVSSITAMVLGTLAAYALHRFRSWLQNLHSMLVTLPLVMPDILMGMSLLAFFLALGVELGMATIWIAHVTFCVSFVTMVVLGRLQDFDFTLLDAARDLGASPRVAAGKVLVPLLLPNDTATPGNTTLPLRVASMMKGRNLPMIHALSTLMIASTFLLAALAFRLQRRYA
jgi:spermidine/putrescine transport system permease protein